MLAEIASLQEPKQLKQDKFEPKQGKQDHELRLQRQIFEQDQFLQLQTEIKTKSNAPIFPEELDTMTDVNTPAEAANLENLGQMIYNSIIQQQALVKTLQLPKQDLIT